MPWECQVWSTCITSSWKGRLPISGPDWTLGLVGTLPFWQILFRSGMQTAIIDLLTIRAARKHLPFGPELWRKNSPRLCYHLIQQTWIRFTKTSATSSAQQPKDLFHAVVETTTYRAEIQSVRTSTECSRDPTETILAELPQPCSLGSTRNRGPMV